MFHLTAFDMVTAFSGSVESSQRGMTLSEARLMGGLTIKKVASKPLRHPLMTPDFLLDPKVVTVFTQLFEEHQDQNTLHEPGLKKVLETLGWGDHRAIEVITLYGNAKNHVLKE